MCLGSSFDRVGVDFMCVGVVCLQYFTGFLKNGIIFILSGFSEMLMKINCFRTTT